MVGRQMMLTAPFALFEPVWLQNRFVSTGMFPDYSFVVLDSGGTAKGWIAGNLPYSEDVIEHRSGRARLNRGRIAVDPRGDRIAVAYQSTNRIDILTSDDLRPIVTSYGPHAVHAKYRIWNDDARGLLFAWEDDNPFGYVSLDADSSNIYALFCGDCIERDGLPRELHVFSWAGVLERTFLLDREVRSIAVSEHERFVFGALEDPYPAIAVWRLPDVTP